MLEGSKEELLRGYREARCLVSALNALHRTRISLADGAGGAGRGRLGVKHIGALLALYELGKTASVTHVSSKIGVSTRQALELLRELEEAGLARVFSTPSRVYALLTKEGEENASELLKILSALV